MNRQVQEYTKTKFERRSTKLYNAVFSFRVTMREIAV